MPFRAPCLPPKGSVINLRHHRQHLLSLRTSAHAGVVTEGNACGENPKGLGRFLVGFPSNRGFPRHLSALACKNYFLLFWARDFFLQKL